MPKARHPPLKRLQITKNLIEDKEKFDFWWF